MGKREKRNGFYNEAIDKQKGMRVLYSLHCMYV